MAKLMVSDELWALVETVLPVRKPNPKGGHPPVSDRVCLTGILFVLKTGIGWEDFPQEMGCCGMTLWNRLKAWTDAGVWPRLNALLLAKLRGVDRIDFSRVVVDSASERAVFGGRKQAQIPPIVAKTASDAHRRPVRRTRFPATPSRMPLLLAVSDRVVAWRRWCGAPLSRSLLPASATPATPRRSAAASRKLVGAEGCQLFGSAAGGMSGANRKAKMMLDPASLWN